MEEFIESYQTNLIYRFTAAGLTVKKTQTNNRIYELQCLPNCYLPVSKQ